MFKPCPIKVCYIDRARTLKQARTMISSGETKESINNYQRRARYENRVTDTKLQGFLRHKSLSCKSMVHLHCDVQNFLTALFPLVDPVICFAPSRINYHLCRDNIVITQYSLKSPFSSGQYCHYRIFP
jgi:hypothetical protein